MDFPGGKKGHPSAIVGIAREQTNIHRGGGGDRTTMSHNDPSARTVMSPKDFAKAYPLAPDVVKRATWLFRAVSARSLHVDRSYKEELRSVKITPKKQGVIGKTAVFFHPFIESRPPGRASGVEQMRLRVTRAFTIGALASLAVYGVATEQIPFISSNPDRAAAAPDALSGSGVAEPGVLTDPGVISNGQSANKKKVKTSFLDGSIKCKEAVSLQLTDASLDASKPVNMLNLMSNNADEAFTTLPPATYGLRFIKEVLQNKSLNPDLDPDTLAQGTQMFVPSNCTGRGL